MATHAIVIQWGAIIAGREQLAMATFLGAVEFFSGLKNKKSVEDLRVYVSEQGNLSDLAGMIVVDGTKAQIDQVRESKDYKVLITKAYHLVEPLRVTTQITGDEIPQRIELLNNVRRELGIA
jgi:hypothetical protein